MSAPLLCAGRAAFVSSAELRDFFHIHLLRWDCAGSHCREELAVEKMTDARRRPNGPRRYVRLSRLQAGEDERREYKGHRCLSCEEIPQRFKHSRRAISRYKLPLCTCIYHAVFLLKTVLCFCTHVIFLVRNVVSFAPYPAAKGTSTDF